jgi:hypothetical protein
MTRRPLSAPPARPPSSKPVDPKRSPAMTGFPGGGGDGRGRLYYIARPRLDILAKGECWVGPFQIRKLLETAADRNAIRPPERHSAYVVTQRTWHGNPPRPKDPAARGPVLYVGGNTRNPDRFRTRIGDLLADAFGFYASLNGHHSGGQSLHEWCLENGTGPLDLHLAWVEGTKCHRCLEIRLYEALRPLLNRARPSRCELHIPK